YRESLSADHGSVYVFNGAKNFASGTPTALSSANDILSINRGAQGQGPLTVTSGDFDGDGVVDIAVGDTFASSGAGRAYVFSDVAAQALPGVALLPTITITGSNNGDGFGVLPATPHLDLNGDRIDDLLVGAPSISGSINGYQPFAGSVFVLYGS